MVIHLWCYCFLFRKKKLVNISRSSSVSYVTRRAKDSVSIWYRPKSSMHTTFGSIQSPQSEQKKFELYHICDEYDPNGLTSKLDDI